MNRSKLLIVIAIFLSIGCGILFPNISNRKSYALDVLPQDTGNEIMVLDQQKLSVYQNPVEITKLYNKNQLIGVITDMKSLDETLDKVYKEDYEERAVRKNSSLSFYAEFSKSRINFARSRVRIGLAGEKFMRKNKKAA